MNAVAITDPILRAGAVAAALTAVLGFTAMILRFSVKQFVKAVRDEMGEVTPKIDKVYQNTMELKPNGGSSVADAIRRLEATQLEIIVEQKAQRAELRQQREVIEGQKEALIEHLADHRKL